MYGSYITEITYPQHIFIIIRILIVDVANPNQQMKLFQCVHPSLRRRSPPSPPSHNVDLYKNYEANWQQLRRWTPLTRHQTTPPSAKSTPLVACIWRATSSRSYMSSKTACLPHVVFFVPWQEPSLALIPTKAV